MYEWLYAYSLQSPFHVQSRRINIALIWRILKFTADIMPTTLIDQINWVAFDSFLALNLIWLKSILFRS